MMRFTVASWHTRPVAFWLERLAFTTMASPPKWATEHKRNLAVFAPPPRIVFGNVSQEDYVAEYRRVMQRRLPFIQDFLIDHDGEHVYLLCACPGNNIDERFCHRYLIAKLLTWLGCEEVAMEVEVKA